MAAPEKIQIGRADGAVAAGAEKEFDARQPGKAV
jgi:hypothetical protein